MHKSLPLVDDLLPNRLSHPRHPHSRWPQFYSLKDHSTLKLGGKYCKTNLRVRWGFLHFVVHYFILKNVKK